jgi:TetR/AcrR family transcriptional repressor of nem operon
VKVSKEKAAENRAALVRAAGKLFSEHGIDGVGVAEIGQGAGLTHGALFAQFPSKDALAAEALADGLERSHARMIARSKKAAPTIGDYLDFFINKRHRDNIATGCAMAASGSEVARQNRGVSRSFAQGFDRMARAIEAVLDDTSISATARERALTLAAAEIGAIIVSRGVAKSNPSLSEEILSASRRVLGQVGGEERSNFTRLRGAPQ